MPNDNPTFQDRVELFAHVIQFGFNFSHSMKFDLLLSGSIIGPQFFTLFASNKTKTPNIERKDVIISLGSASSFDNSMYILPYLGQALRKDILDDFINRIVETRAEFGNDKYINYSPHQITSDLLNFQVERMSAINCQFRFGRLIDKAFKKELGVDSNGAVRIGDWNAGINEMLRYVSSIPNPNSLPSSEIEVIRNIYRNLEQLYQAPSGP